MTNFDSDNNLLIIFYLNLSCLIGNSSVVTIIRNLFCLNNYFIQMLQCSIYCVIVSYLLYYNNQLAFYIYVVTDYLTFTKSVYIYIYICHPLTYTYE